MANPIRIYSGPGDVALWDSVNGYWWLGYNKEIALDCEPVLIDISEGNQVQKTVNSKLKASIVQSDSALIAILKARRTKKQKIFIVTPESMYVLQNVIPSLSLKRGQKAGEAHSLDLTAQTLIENDLTMYENLLKTYGGMTGAGPVADGWETNVGTRSLATSHLGGGYGNEQRLTFTADNQYFRTLLNYSGLEKIVFDNKNYYRITVCANVKEYGGALSYFRIGFDTVDDSDSILASYYAEKSISANAAIRVSHTAIIAEEEICKIRAGFQDGITGNAANIGVDNVQLEFGELTDYKEV